MYNVENFYWVGRFTGVETCSKCNNETLHVKENKYAFEKWCIQCGYFTYRWHKCCNNPDPIRVIYIISDNRPSLREQCLNCGRLMQGKAISFKGIDQESLRYFDESLAENRNLEIESLRQDYLKKKEFNSTLRYEKRYLDYIKSDKWKALRLTILERDSFICQRCKKQNACHVHHLTYDRLGCELPEDLISICLNCHIKEHPNNFVNY